MAEPIAIVGMACRFGGAPNLAAYWDLLASGRDGTSDYPGRHSAAMDRFYAAAGTELGPPSARAGFLEHIDRFDAEFFGISPREAELMDPQQRVLLELAWDAMEDAGATSSGLAGRRTGVFVGIWSNGYESVIDAQTTVADLFGLSGNGIFGASGRLAYAFDLQGPELAVNSGCASSLTALHQARRALLEGTCDVAIAAGANVLLRPNITQAYARAGLLAADGRCKFGDAGADGFVRSEGAGVVILKRLSQARRENDRIYALIRGSAINNSGSSSQSLSRPSEHGQAAVVREALDDAGLTPSDIDYVEAHGTGTFTGDRVELGALSLLFAGDSQRTAPCRVGSAKTNVGHTEAAAGIAGVIKVALAMHHGFLPASLHVHEPNPDIDWSLGTVALQTRGEPWTNNRTRRAGVSSFGIAGANAHTVLEEAPAPLASDAESRDGFILTVSARSNEALTSLATAYAARLEDGADAGDVGYSATRRRSEHPFRFAAAGANARELIEQLRAFAASEAAVAPVEARAAGGRGIVMVFPGQGSQWVGMGRRLFELEPVFRASIQATDQAIRAEAGWSLIEQLCSDDAADRLTIDRIQPALFAVEVALAELWASFGQKPAVCLGHSMGEVAAAHIAGALRLEDAVAVICRRSALMMRFNGQGAMALVELSYAQAEQVIAGREQLVSIAVNNGPRSTVLSGDPGTLERILDELRAKDVFCRPVAVDVAAHSPQMDAIADELTAALQDIAPRRGHTPIYSTTLGKFTDGSDFDAAYWAANLRRPVRFYSALQALMADGYDAFIEASPHPVLLSAIEGAASDEQAKAETFASLRRDQPEQIEMLASLGRLFASGFAVDWAGVYRRGTITALPPYPWRRERFWVHGSADASAGSAMGSHPMLGAPFTSANGDRAWMAIVDPVTFPWLGEHAVRGSAVLPASAYLELGQAAAGDLYPGENCAIEQLTLKEAIVLSPASAVQILVTPKSPGRDALKYFVREHGAAEWALAAAGIIARRGPATTEARVDPAFFEAASLEPTRNGAQHAERLAALGYDYGPTFRCIDAYAVDGAELAGTAHLPQTNVSGYALHPALLDAAFQALAALLIDTRGDGSQLLPFRIDGARFAQRGAPVASVLFTATVTDPDGLRGDVRVYAPDGMLLAQIDGLSFKAVGREAARPGDELLYLPEWTPAPREAARGAARGRWLVLGAAGSPFCAALERRGFAAQAVTTNLGADARALTSMVAGLALSDIAQPLLGVADFRALDLVDDDTEAVARHCASVAALASALDDEVLGCRLWLVTRGACGLVDDAQVAVSQAAVWGLGAVIANERPGIACSLVDLAPEGDSSENDALVAELSADGKESRVALRQTHRFVERVTVPASDLFAETHAARQLREDERFVLRVPNSGMLDGMTLDSAPRRSPLADEVEIAVEAAGLNFLDVMRAMGLFDPDLNGSPALGTECAGTVVRVGSNVTSFAVGDQVVALSPAFERIGAVTSHLVTPEVLVAPKPRALSFAQAAALPCVYLTCYYALVEVARMRSGETLLVHSATGGVGLAAIEIARRLGLEVFATAGTEEKRAFLRALGVKHVMDSRAAGFAEAIAADTGGRGVDAILNSLSGKAIPEGLTALAPYGRFLEIGKRDMWDDSRIGMGAFLHNRSFSGIDLATLVEDRPELVGEMLRTVMTMVDEGVLAPLPITTYPAASAIEAFHQMAQAKHIGKLVIDTRPSDVLVRDDTPAVRDDATYLITGGLGALGLISARALVDEGARHLVLCARREPSPAARETIAALERRGAQVVVRQLDIAHEPSLRALLEEMRATMAPLRGVVHSAGVLADALLEELTPQHFEEVMAGKVDGALLLDRLTREDDLDAFVMFSSVAALLGSPGQGNYAAANAMLDAIAQRRAGQGLPALSVAWGPWADVGLAAAHDNRGARIEAQGLISIAPDEGLALLRRLLAADTPRLAAMRFDVARWSDTVAAGDRSCLFDKLSHGTGLVRNLVSGLAAVRAASPENAPVELRRLVVAQLAAVLRLAPEQIVVTKAFRALGLDSLMGLELRNRLERSLELKLTASVIWNYSTVDRLCAYLTGQLGLAAAEPANAVPAQAEADDLDSELAEAEALLASL